VAVPRRTKKHLLTELKLKIPKEVKSWLVDDWDLITPQKQLFYLPAKKNVDSILEDYSNYKNLEETPIIRSILLMKLWPSQRVLQCNAGCSAALQI
jgi:hypothetical protein